jgi:hypothetical protein
MNKKKVLVASGCSFTAYPDCWPSQIKEKYNLELVNGGAGSQGNALIARKVIAYVQDLINIKGYHPDEIIVGVMWSGIDRADRYVDGGDMFIGPPFTPESPTAIIDNRRNWRIMNVHWQTSEDCKQWYRIFNHGVSSMVYTLEHILRVQMYLDKLGIKYFMTTYMDMWIHDFIRHAEVAYLWDMVDWKKFLPVKGCYEWVDENYPIDGFKPAEPNGWRDQHPTPFGQERFAHEVIVPFIEENKLINN